MLQLELTREQATELRDVLESYLGDLRMEIAGTEQKEFREALKRRKELLNDVVARLNAA